VHVRLINSWRTTLAYFLQIPSELRPKTGFSRWLKSPVPAAKDENTNTENVVLDASKLWLNRRQLL